jgi:hypothetical protein
VLDTLEPGTDTRDDDVGPFPGTLGLTPRDFLGHPPAALVPRLLAIPLEATSEPFLGWVMGHRSSSGTRTARSDAATSSGNGVERADSASTFT